MPYLEDLKFHTVGYGCTTCIGNSGALPEEVAQAVTEHDLVVSAVLSGNRNFEGRINPLVKLNYLASPMLVVAYAIAGTVDIDLDNEPLGHDAEGQPVYLRDIWPTQEEIAETITNALKPEMFVKQYSKVFDGDEKWQSMDVPRGRCTSSIRSQPTFRSRRSSWTWRTNPAELTDIEDARPLAILGDSITTDHISPAGAIPPNSPAAEYLKSHGVAAKDFNTFGARRGNHEVMMRGTFGNIRLRNLMAPGTEGGVYHP